MQKQHQSKEERERQRQKRAERRQIKAAQKTQKIIRRGDVEFISLFEKVFDEWKNTPLFTFYVLASTAYTIGIGIYLAQITLIFILFLSAIVMSVVVGFIFHSLITYEWQKPTSNSSLSWLVVALIAPWAFILPMLSFTCIVGFGTAIFFKITGQTAQFFLLIASIFAGIGASVGFIIIGQILEGFRQRRHRKSRKGKTTHE